MKVCEVSLCIAGKHCVHIPDHVPKSHSLLKHVFSGTPDVSLFHCLKVRKELVFGAQFPNRREFPVNGAVVDQNVGVLRGSIK